MIFYSLLYTINVSIKYALDLDNYVMYVFIFILVIELICIMTENMALRIFSFYFKWISFMCAASYIIASFFVGNILVKSVWCILYFNQIFGWQLCVLANPHNIQDFHLRTWSKPLYFVHLDPLAKWIVSIKLGLSFPKSHGWTIGFGALI